MADAGGFDAFAHSRADRLYRAAVLMSGNPADAQDLVQTTLATMFRVWPRVARAGDPDGYAYRVLVNTHRKWWRRASRQTAAAVSDGEPAPDIAGLVVDRSLVLQALAGLPPRQRAVLLLRYYADMTEGQTAAALGCSIGTIKSQTAKAMQRLRADPALQRDLREEGVRDA